MTKLKLTLLLIIVAAALFGRAVAFTVLVDGLVGFRHAAYVALLRSFGFLQHDHHRLHPWLRPPRSYAQLAPSKRSLRYVVAGSCIYGRSADEPPLLAANHVLCRPRSRSG